MLVHQTQHHYSNIKTILLFMSLIGVLFYTAKPMVSQLGLIQEQQPNAQDQEPGTQDIRSQATTNQEPIFVLANLTYQDDKIILESVEKFEGMNLPLITQPNPELILDQIVGEEIVDSIPLNFTIYYDGDRSGGQLKDSLTIAFKVWPKAQLQIRKTETGEIIPLINAQLLSSPSEPTTIINEDELIIESVDLNSSDFALDDPDQQVLGVTQNNYSNNISFYNGQIDFVFVSSNYTDRAKFDQHVNHILQHLLTYEPFNQHRNDIKIKKIFTQSINCNIPYVGQTLIECNRTALVQLLKYVWVDNVIVLYDSNQPAGTAYDRIAIVSTDVDYLSIAVHELGHAFGRLADEYLVDHHASSNTQFVLSRANCDVASCPKWENIDGTDCLAGCYYPNLYRSSENSIMRHYFEPGGNAFNRVSINQINREFANFLQTPLTPSAPTLSSSCITTQNGRQPIIRIQWPANYQQAVSVANISKNPTFDKFWSSTIKKVDLVTANNSSQYFQIIAPANFLPQSNQPALNLSENTQYYVNLWNGFSSSPTRSIRTATCSTGNTLRGDFNQDNIINLLDFNVFVSEYGRTGNPGFTSSDMDNNGRVDILDFNAWVVIFRNAS